MHRYALAFVIVIGSLLAFSASDAQPPQSESPAGQQFAAWLAAYDGADWNAYLRFLQKNFVTPPGPMLKDSMFRDRHRRLRPQEDRKRNPDLW